MSPSKYLTRFTSIDKQLPSCSAHYELLTQSDIKDFLRIVSHDPHASTHGVIGGVYGCDLFRPLLDAGYILHEQGNNAIDSLP
jgi:hypothetical protein